VADLAKKRARDRLKVRRDPHYQKRARGLYRIPTLWSGPTVGCAGLPENL